MPHKCTKCEHIFVDGDANILNGCPECGWNKFLYVGKNAHQSSEEKPSRKNEDDTAADSGVKEINDVLEKGKEDVINKPEPRHERGPRVESIRILEKGSYELNIDALMTRKELVMAMKEDGTYEIHLPSMFKDTKPAKGSKKSKKK